MKLDRRLLATLAAGIAIAGCGSDGEETSSSEISPEIPEPDVTDATEPDVTEPEATEPEAAEADGTEPPDTEPAPTPTAEDLSPVLGARLPSDLEAGQYSITSVSLPMTFELPEAMQLQDNAGALVVLTPGTDGFEGRNLVVIADTTGTAGPGDITDPKSTAANRANDVDDLLPPTLSPAEWAATSGEIDVEAEGIIEVAGADVPWFDMRTVEGLESYGCDLGPVCINTLHHPMQGYFEAGLTLRYRIYDLAVLQPGSVEQSRLVVMVQSRNADRDTMNALGDAIVGSIVPTA